MRMKHDKFKERVFVCLGSNIGDKERYLAEGRERIASCPDIRLKRMSPTLQNPALLYTEQEDFLNQVLELETRLTPEELLHFLKKTEKTVGRKPRFRYGPRELDLDILSYGTDKIHTDDLKVPHPGLYDRPFLAQLLSSLGESVSTLTGTKETP